MSTNWLQRTLSLLAEVQNSHCEERQKTELDIESHPLEPQLSGKVNELMAAEEEAAKKRQSDRLAKLSARVDSQLRQECRDALLYIIDLHNTRRSKVYTKHTAERESLTRRVLAELKADAASAASAAGAAGGASTRAGNRQAAASFGTAASGSSTSFSGGDSTASESGEHGSSSRSSCASASSSFLPRVPSASTVRPDPVPPSPKSTSKFTLPPALSTGVGGGAGAGTGLASPATSPTSSTSRVLSKPTGDFKSKERDMCRRQDTAWHQAELFNLTQAFQRQLDRIRTEWGDYLVAMDKEYITEQARLEGESPAVALQRYEAERGTVARSGGASDKWLSKEKQEQLIHTAPVLSPGGSMPASFADGKVARGRPVSPSRVRAAPVTAAVKRQMQDLRQRYLFARREVLVQRDSALRWVTRQRNRMLMQVEAAQAERAFRDAHEAKEEQAWEELRRLVQARVAEVASRPQPVVAYALPVSPMVHPEQPKLFTPTAAAVDPTLTASRRGKHFGSAASSRSAASAGRLRVQAVAGVV